MTVIVDRAPAGQADDFTSAVDAVVRRIDPGARLETLKQLSGGASQELWLIVARDGEHAIEMVMRRSPGGDCAKRDDAIGLVAEAGVMRAAAAHGVPVPDILHVLEPGDGLGTGFLMRRVEGETVARRIFREPRFAAARPGLARSCGEILAHIARVPVDQCPPLPAWPARKRLDDAHAVYLAQGQRRPVFDYAFRWLYERLPARPGELRLVHGDFRNGNLIIDERGVAAVLDWEIAHIGDSMEDLGWL
ncbi:MAG: phosphotransferase family protein, partial [Sphingobium sp.]